MGIVALITWLITALGGGYMLYTWLSRGGMRQQGAGSSRLPVPVIFGHFGLAALGLVLWIVYVAADVDALAWVSFIILLPVAALGFTMLARWIPAYRARAAAVPAGAGAPGGTAAADEPAEQRFPPAIVLGHGLFAVITLLLVLITALSG